MNPNKCTFVTSFSSERNQWMRAKCINIHDPQSRLYELAQEYDGRRAVAMNFFKLLESHQHHSEAKSLAPNGKVCEFDTRGLLQRAQVAANWPPIYIGKEFDKHWEEGEDLSLLEFKTRYAHQCPCVLPNWNFVLTYWRDAHPNNPAEFHNRRVSQASPP